jgi:hypothetical protein
MAVQRVLRNREVRALYGNPCAATWYYWRRVGRVPKPDVMLGAQVPGWFESTLERHQKEMAKRGTKARRVR